MCADAIVSAGKRMRGEDRVAKWREPIFQPIERFRVTFTPNGKRAFIPRDQVFSHNCR